MQAPFFLLVGEKQISTAVPIAVMFAPLLVIAGAALESLVALVRPMTSRGTVWAGMFNGFMVAVIGVGGTTIAIIPIIGFGSRGPGEEEQAS